MAVNVDVEKLFLRLFMFSHKISLPVVRTFFVSNVLGESNYNNDIITFLEHHKHELFHLFGDYKCCQCTKLSSLQPTVHASCLGSNQFKKLYDVGLSQPGHFLKGSRGRVFQQCLCCVSVRKDTNPKNYDISLLITILCKCVKLSDNSRLWLDTIRKLRNQLCHVPDIGDLTKNDLQTWWGNLECSVLSLAGEVHAQPAYKESIELLVDMFKYADYSRDTIAPFIEAMKAEINNNVNGVIQHQSEKLIDHMNTLSKQSEEQRNLDKKESDSKLVAVTTEISAKVEACHSEGKRVIELQTIELKDTFEERQQREESLLCAIHKDVEIIKGNMMSHKRDQISFDIQLVNETNPTKNKKCPIKHIEDTGNVDLKEKRIVELKISTPGIIGEKKEEIKRYFEKAVEIINIAAPFEVKYVHDGSITIGTLLSVNVLKNEEEFKSAICIFLDQMVARCNIDTSMPLLVKVKITILDVEQTGTVSCFTEETKKINMIDKAVQAVPIMVDQVNQVQADKNELYPTYHIPELILYGMEIAESVSDRKTIHDIDDETFPFSWFPDHDDILLIGCFKDIDWIASVLTICKNLTLICPIEQIQKSRKVLNRENTKAVIYVASRSSQQSYDLELMLECLAQSKYLPDKVFTIVRDKVLIPDMFLESKQFHVSSAQNAWLPDLIDAIAKIDTNMTKKQLQMTSKEKNDKVAEEYEFINLQSATLATIEKIEKSGACSHLTNPTNIYRNYFCFFTIGTCGPKRTIKTIVFDSSIRLRSYTDIEKGKKISKQFQCCCIQSDVNIPPTVYWSFGSSTYQYDPFLNKCKRRASLYCKREYFNMISHENHCYVIGGVYKRRFVLEIEKYNIKRDSWKKVAYLPGDCCPINPSCAVFEGLIYIFSAICHMDGQIKPTATAVYVFRPDINTAIQVAEIPFSFKKTKTCVVGSFIYIASDRRHFIRFCPSDLSCVELPDQIQECKDFGMLTMQRSIIIAGGDCRGKELKDIHVYCTVCGLWKTLSEKLPDEMAIYGACELKIPNVVEAVPFYKTSHGFRGEVNSDLIPFVETTMEVI